MNTTVIGHKPTAEQQNIILAASRGSQNIMVRAYAGCAKTSTLKMLAKELRPLPALAIAFNKKIANELEAALPSFFTVKTMNGLGHQAWGRALQGQRLVLVDRKIGKIVSDLFKEQKYEAGEEDWIEVRDWVEAARKAGIIHRSYEGRFQGLHEDAPENWIALSDRPEPSETLMGFAREALRRSIAMALQGQIDFDDQIYASVLMGGVYPQFPLVLVDEAQDLSPLNHLQVAKALAPAGRLIAVGDPKQAIYGFRGADSASMAKIKGLRPEESWLELPLHMTFRCPKIIVRRNEGHAPGFRAAEGNEQGEHRNWLRQGEEGLVLHGGEKHEGWSIDWLRGLRQGSKDRIFILCRNNAPLLSMAFKLIRRGIGPTMLGRDIGAGLVRLAKKLAEGKMDLPVLEFVKAVEAWRKDEEAKAQVMQREHLIAGIEDRAECLLAVTENPGVGTAGDLCKALENLFSREHGEIVLATGHKAKGLEAEIVVHLDPWRIPSRFAMRDERQMEQEKNLGYVIETRTRRVLVEANLEDLV